MMSTGIAAAAALLLQAAAQPAWTPVGTDTHGEYAYDPASIVREADKVRVRMRGAAQPDSGLPIRSFTVRLEIDCEAQTLAVLDAQAFDADGDPLPRFARPNPQPPAPIAAGSSQEDAYLALCPGARPIPADPADRAVSPQPAQPPAEQS